MRSATFAAVNLMGWEAVADGHLRVGGLKPPPCLDVCSQPQELWGRLKKAMIEYAVLAWSPVSSYSTVHGARGAPRRLTDRDILAD